jgi:hypothetical protein
MTRTNDIIAMAREWLPKAYRDGDVGDEPKFTKHNMEVAFAAGAAAEREACAAVARQWDADHPASNYGGCIANLIEAREQDAA